MATKIVVPRLGWAMIDGLLSDWLKRDGERVHPGDKLYVLETEKAVAEIEALEEGVLRIPPGAPKSGDKVAVGQLLGYLVAEGEAAPFEEKIQP